MTIENRLYIVDYPIDEQILDIIIQQKGTLKINKLQTKAFVKLQVGDENNYEFLSRYSELSIQQVDEEFKKEEWQ